MSEGEISRRECQAMQLLDDDGWTKGELKMTFQTATYSTVKRHLEGDCSHPRV